MWFGKGSFTNVPIPGGIEALDERLGAAWRKEGTTKSEHSYMKRITMALMEEVDSNPDGKGIYEILKDWDECVCGVRISSFITKLAKGKLKITFKNVRD